MSMWCFFDVENKDSIVKRLEHELQSEVIWHDSKLAKQKQKELNRTKQDLGVYELLKSTLADIETGIEILKEDYDVSLNTEVELNISGLNRKFDDLEIARMFSGDYDSNGAVLTIQSGAGGTESQDWTQILLRMYLRWAERKGFKVAMLDIQHGIEAGIKTVTLKIEGNLAYGLLKSEKGVHRFMRISPFDANKRRQTSFARVDLIPILEELSEVKIDKSDIEIDIYRASGPGGQHRNKVETAVRIKHLPTGIIVRCEASRSQGDNKEEALIELKNRLAYKAIEEQKKKMDDLAGEKSDVSFGHQIRTYIVHSRQVVIDERSGKEYRPVEGILDGDLDHLMSDYLRELSCHTESN